MITEYKYIGRIFGILPQTKDKQYWTELRRVGKWLVTREDRRFDRVSGNSSFKYDFWRLNVTSVKKK